MTSPDMMSRWSFRPHRVAVRAIAAAFAVITFVAFATPAWALSGSPFRPPPPSSTASDSPLGLSLGTYGPEVLEARENFVATAILTNDGLTPVSGVTVSLHVTATPLSSHEAVDAWLTWEDTRDTRHALTVQPRGGSVPAGAPTAVPIVATNAQLGLPAATTGVYGVEITVADDSDDVHRERAVFTWHDATTPVAPMLLIATVAGSDARAGALFDAAIASKAMILADPTSLDESDRAQALTLDGTHGLPAGHLDVASLAFADEPELLDLGLGRSRATFQEDVPWIAIVPQIDETLVAFAQDAGAAGLLRDSGSTEEGMPALGDVNSMLVITPNGPVSRALANAAPANPTSSAVVVAHALLATQANAGAPIVVSPGARWPVADAGAPPAVAALRTAPWIDQTTWEDASRNWPREPIDVAENAPQENAIPSGIVIQAVSALDGGRLVANATVDPVGVLGSAESALFSAMSYDGRLDVATRGDAIAAAIDTLNDIRSSVYVASDTDVNLLSSSGELPVTVRNELDAEITLQVLASSSSPSLVIRDIPTVVVPPDGEAVALVPAHAVASANVNVRVELLDPEGRRLRSSDELRLRVRPQWGDVFTWAVAAMFGLLLVAGATRTIRRGRGDTRGKPSTEPRGKVSP